MKAQDFVNLKKVNAVVNGPVATIPTDANARMNMNMIRLIKKFYSIFQLEFYFFSLYQKHTIRMFFFNFHLSLFCNQKKRMSCLLHLLTSLKISKLRFDPRIIVTSKQPLGLLAHVTAGGVSAREFQTITKNAKCTRKQNCVK